MNRHFALLPLLLVITACNQAPMSADPSVITSRSDAWEDALNARDIDALVELYATDARILPPNGKMQTGRDAVRAEFGAMIDAGLGGELTSIEAMVSGDIGYNVGTYVLTAEGTTVDTGKFVEIYHRGDDGQWRYANDIWNSDTPVAMAEAPHSHVMFVHDVDDGDRWLAAWRGDDSRHKLFEANGAAHVHTFRNPDNPNQTGLVVAVTDMDAINAMLQSDEGQAAAKADGVKMDTMIMLTEAK